MATIQLRWLNVGDRFIIGDPNHPTYGMYSRKGIVTKNKEYEVDVEMFEGGKRVKKTGWSPSTDVTRIYADVPTISCVGKDLTKPTKDKEIPSRKMHVFSTDCMLKKDWNKEKKPNWWVRVGTGTSFRFLTIPEVAGCEKLDVVIDLDLEYIPVGETIYFGVGTAEKGHRDEFPKSLKHPEKIEWYMKPRIGELPDKSDYHVWWTKDYRYRIVRNVPRRVEDYDYDTFCFVACYAKNVVLGRADNMEKCFEFILKDMMHRHPDKSYSSNSDDLLIKAGLEGLDYLPDRPFKVEPEPQEEDKPKKEKRPGVTSTMIEELRKASKKNPMTKEDILDVMIDKFPDKDMRALMTTISARLSDLPKRYGVEGLRKNKKNQYWIEA